jgi:hypothetical protein
MTREIGRLSTLVMVLLVATVSAAQSTSVHNGKITGEVIDPTGASVLHARVLLVNLTTLGTQNLEVQPDSRFAFSNLEAGRYAVIAVSPNGPGSVDCWQPTINQLTLREDVLATVQLKLLLDSKKCKVVDDLQVR